MKRLLVLLTVVACVPFAGALRVESSASCSTASFAAAPSIKVAANIIANDLIAVAVGDLNNDGRADIVTSNGSSNTVSAVLASGQGFSPAANFPVGAIRPFSVTVGDFNNDGKADAVTANNASDNLSLLLGDGAGGFSAPSHVSGGPAPIFVVNGDFNGDGNLDLAVANRDGAAVNVLLGNGAGGFGPFSSFAVGNSPRALLAADFNLDGKLDLAVANRGSHNISILLGDGAGGFAPLPAFLSGTNPEYLAAADFNLDGILDLAVANSGAFTVSVFIGTGDGRFGSVTNFPVGSVVNSVAVGDFNNDGKPDLAAGTNAAGVAVRLGDGAGNFGAAKTFRPAGGPLYLVVTDFNLDGSEDLVAASAQADTLSPLAGDGAGNFRTTPFVTTGANAISLALADFNADGKLDAALAHDSINTVSVRLGTGTGTFGTAASFAVGARPFWVSAGDLNNDGNPDLVTANFLGGNVSVLLGDGAGGFGSATNFALNAPVFNPWFVAVSDVSNDGKADLLVLRLNRNDVTVLLGDGAGGFTSQVSYPTSFGPQALAVGDFNGDAKPDLAVSDSSFSILLGDGAGAFGPPTTTSFADNTGPGAIVAGDFNADGKLDLAVANRNTHDVSVLLGDGTGKFAPRVNYRVGLRPVSLAVGDVNGDGRPDLVAGNFTTHNVTVLLGDGAGGFGSATEWGVPASTNSIALGDLNGDGRTDIAAAAGSNLATLLNTCGDAAAPPDARLSVSDVTVTETDSGTVNAVFTVSLAAASAQTVTAKYFVSAGSAEANEDFQPEAGTFTFAPGVTSQTVTIPVVGDTADELDERFSLNLYEPVNALITDRQGTATIVDNDAEPSVSIGNVSVPEGQSPNNFVGLTVALSQVSGKSVTVAYATADGTAQAGSDYTAVSGTLTIPPGTESRTITVQVTGDTVNEPNETFFVNLSNPVNASLAVAQATATLINDDAPTLQFIGPVFVANEGNDRSVFVAVTRTGDTSGESRVSYATFDGTASERKDYTAALGQLRFAPGETLKSFQIVITDDAFAEDTETFTLTLGNPIGATLGANATATAHIGDNDAANGPSPVRDASFNTEFFVRQHYADFLNRVPDAGGLGFWVGGIESCGADQQCREVKKIDTSAAFFLSIEFQETGFLAVRTHKAAFGNLVAKPVPVSLRGFLADSRQLAENVIVGTPGWPEQLEANKQAYFAEFVTRADFTLRYPQGAFTAAEFVDALFASAGVVPTQAERDAALAAYGAGGNTGRAAALRSVAESQTLKQAETNRAFVLMQYFGYLRRNPDDTDFQGNPDPQFLGYNFWLNKLNQFNGNYVEAEMVKAFIQSIEYGDRFGQ